MTAALALCASLLWGTSDFLGGTVARRLDAVAVVAVSQSFALVALLVAAAGTDAWSAPIAYLGWALAAALVGVLALVSFYAALAAGTMGVVAPVAALGVVAPVVVGVAQGGRPSTLAGAGIAVAVLGVVLASGPDLRAGTPAGRDSRRPLLLALVAAAGFGAVIICVAHGAATSTTMTLLVMRVTSVALLAPLMLTRRARTPVSRGDLPVLAAIGFGDVGANATFAVASTRGLLAVVAVLSSLYPAVTVLLARVVHVERLQRIQLVGVFGALAGVVLIASGGGTG
jgi:drug/metabolite transporter (DMT)-like permease